MATITALVSCYSPEARHWPPPDAAAGVVLADAAPPDAALPDAPPPDAPPPPIAVTISVMGPGTVTLVGSGICTKQCTLFAAYGLVATVEAQPIDNKNEFVGWTGAACSGQPATCTFLPLLPVTISAKFAKAD